MYFLIKIKEGNKTFFFNEKKGEAVTKFPNPFFGKQYKTAYNAQRTADKLKSLFSEKVSITVVYVDENGSIKPVK